MLLERHEGNRVSLQQAFTILDHPSDLGIEATGATLADAFASAAAGMMSVIVDPSTVNAVEQRPVHVSASDIGQLLVRWLSEVLYLYDGGRFIACRFDVRQLTATALDAVIHGEMLDLARHRTRLDVKAVTYHQLLIEETTGARVRVYLDI